MRPDGRAPTPETRKLRVTTRALRYHLDTLPIEYDLDVSADSASGSMCLDKFGE